MTYLAKRVKAAIQAFRNPALKYYGGMGLSDMWYGGAAGLTTANRDLTFTEAGAATAFGVVVEVQRGVMFIADSIAMLPAGIYDSRTDEPLIALDARELNMNAPGATFIRATRDYERVWKHNFLNSVVYSDWLYGETFVARLHNDFGGVSGLRWLNPLYTEPQRQRGRIGYFQYSGEDGYSQIPVTQMAYHIHHRNSFDDLRGLSPVLSALPSMNIGRNAERSVMSYFRNGMVLGGVMMPKGETSHLHELEITKLERKLEQNNKGVDRAWSWAISPVEMLFQSFDQPDLQKNYAVVKDASKKIMMALGVPPSLAGDPEAVNYDNADKIMTNWLKVNGRAYANKVAGFINTMLLPYFEPGAPVYFKFDFTQIDRPDAALTQSDFSAGIITITEAQAKRGYEVDKDLANIYVIGGKPVHKDTLLQIAHDPATFGVQPTPLMLQMPNQQSAALPALPAPVEQPEPQKGAASLCVMLSLANNPDLIDLQKRLKTMYPDPAVRWNDPADFHITLLYVPAVEDTQIDEMVQALPDAETDGLSLKVGSLACFDNVGEYALHFRIARNSGLLDMQAALFEACEIAGLQASGYSRPERYTPHITMGYLPEYTSRITFHGKVSVTPVGVTCSVERGGDYEVVYPVADEPPPEPEKSISIAHGEHTHDLPIVTRDYSPDKALAELKAWQNYVTRGKSKRPFVFDMLRGDPADYITERLAAGDSAGDIAKALKPRFDGSRLKALAAQAEAVFKALYSDNPEEAIKSISGLESDYVSRFTGMLRDFRDSKPRNPDKAADILRFLNQNFVRSAYIEGMAAGGVEDEPDNDDNTRIRELVSDANSYVSSFIDTLYDVGITDAQAALKAGQWWRGAIMPAHSAGLLSANGNLMMEFGGEDGEEICPTCQRLKGQRHRFKHWKARNLDVPHIGQATECEGWKCLHKLIPVTGKAVGNW